MKTRDIKKFIERAEEKYKDLTSICSVIANEAQKYVDWGKISCGYFPADGVCIFVDVSFDFVKAELFFKYIREHDNKPITIEEFEEITI